MGRRNPLVSLIVPVKDNLRYTKLMMESYQEHTAYKNRELIFVDNGSKKPTRGYLRILPDVEAIVRFSRNIGFPAGVNAGIEEAKGDLIGILNNDILLSHGWLTKMVRLLNRQDDLGIVSPLRIGMANGHPEILMWQVKGLEHFPDSSFTVEKNVGKLREEMDSFVAKLENRFSGEYCSNHTMLPFFCTVIRREVFHDVGMLDEEFGVGLVEDTYFCRRAVRAGWGLASCLDNYVHHFCSRTLIQVLGTQEAMEKAMQQNYRLMEAKLAAET